MKKILLLLVSLLFVTVGFATETISPVVAEKFGQVVTVEGVFVGKQNTYHDQNLVKQPFLLKVLSVNGKSITNPVVIEYDGKILDVSPGVRYRMKAYETIYTLGWPTHWELLPSQMSYRIIHILAVKDVQSLEH